MSAPPHLSVPFITGEIPLQAIQLSEEELRDQALTPAHLKLAAAILSCRGYVILKTALAEEEVAAIGGELADILEDCQDTASAETSTAPHAVPGICVSRSKRATFWHRKARWRIFPRLTGAIASPRLLANPFVVPILEQLLGNDLHCKFVSSDTCLRGSILQAPHSDIVNSDTFSNNRWRARGYIVNVPTMECGLHNGPLEVWPGGSHLWADDLLAKHGLSPYVQDGRNPPVELAAAYFGSVKLALLPGEILIRDLAMWHRGTPNPTDEARTMMTIAYFRNGHAHGYGDPTYNLDRALFEELHPSVQRMFRAHFTLGEKLRRRKESVRGVVARLFT